MGKKPVNLRKITMEGLPTGRILYLNIEELAGEHGLLNIAIQTDAPMKIVELLRLSEKKFKLKIGGDIFFCGVIVRCEEEEKGDKTILYITGATLSRLFDKKKRSRTFQATDKTIDDVAATIKKESEVKDANIQTAAKTKIEEFLYQDRETDWEFLKRLGGGKLLFADSKSDAPRVSFAPLPSKVKNDIAVREISTNAPLAKVALLKENVKNDLKPVYFIETEIITTELKIGAGYEINYNGKTQVVIRSKIISENGILLNRVKFTPKDGLFESAKEILKERGKGKYLTGKVLEAMGKDKNNKGNDNSLKIHFDCDKEQDSAKARWIPYSNVVNNYMYSMPDKGDKVVVYFEEGGLLLALGSLREKEAFLDKLQPTQRVFASEGQSVELAPEDITIATKDKEMSLQEKFNEGIFLKSKKNVNITSDSDLSLQASAGNVSSNQPNIIAPHSTGYIAYTSTGGQPAKSMISTAADMLGESPENLKNSGAKLEKTELSDLAKELDKKIGADNKKKDEKKSTDGNSGTLKIKGNKAVILAVGNSSIDIGKGKIKTKALFTGAYMPGAGVGGGQPAAIGNASVNNAVKTSAKEQGTKDRPRIKYKE